MFIQESKHFAKKASIYSKKITEGKQNQIKKRCMFLCSSKEKKKIKEEFIGFYTQMEHVHLWLGYMRIYMVSKRRRFSCLDKFLWKIIRFLLTSKPVYANKL